MQHVVLQVHQKPGNMMGFEPGEASAEQYVQWKQYCIAQL